MASKQTTCPVCMTKMQSVGHDLVCPVCGYKYCGNQPYIYDDHNHNQYRSYSQKTTYSETAQPRKSQSYSQSSTYSAPKAQNTSQSASQSGQTAAQPKTSNRQPKKPSVAKLVVRVLLIYFFFAILSMVINMLNDPTVDFSFLEKLFSENGRPVYSSQTTSPEPAPAEVSEPVDFAELDPFGLKDPSHGKDTYLQQFASSAFSKPIEEIDAGDCGSVVRMDFYCDSDDFLTVCYFLGSDAYNTFSAPLESFDPSELRAFYNLEMLDLSSPGDLTLCPGDLDGLHSLILLGCSNSPAELADIIPPSQLEALLLNLPNCSLSLAEIERFENLSLLSVRAGLLEDAERIGRLSRLYNLALEEYGNLSDFSFLSSLGNLHHLELSCPSLADISFLKGTPQMTILSVSGARALEDLTPLQFCPSLEFLNLSENTGIRDYRPISGHENLSQLYLNNCELQELDWISDLENLGILSIMNNHVTSLAPLASLPQLDRVICSGNDITDYGSLDTSAVDLY